MADQLVTKCRTPKFKTSYAQWLFKPQLNDDGNEKYSCVMLFPKGTDLTEMKQCAKNAAINKFGAAKADAMLKDRNFKWPFRDGNTKDDDVYKDTIFLSGNSTNPPGVAELVDNILERNVGPMDVYSGCEAMATVNFYYFNKKGNQGIGCGLNNLVKTGDGERLGGAAPMDEDFAEYASGAGAPDGAPPPTDDDDPLR